MRAKGNLRTQRYTSVSFFDVMPGIKFGVFVSNSAFSQVRLL